MNGMRRSKEVCTPLLRLMKWRIYLRVYFTPLKHDISLGGVVETARAISTVSRDVLWPNCAVPHMQWQDCKKNVVSPPPFIA